MKKEKAVQVHRFVLLSDRLDLVVAAQYVDDLVLD